MNYHQKTLENGLKIITVPLTDSPSVTILVMVSTGSKYEERSENGLSHFLEHMCFKGTTKRPRSIDISRELDSIGSQSSAFTSQEFTGYYAKSHPKHFKTILDVVSDIYQNPVFDEAEIEKEKGVIIEEINMYEDMPHRMVHELFLSTLYGDQPAGWTVLGPKENILKMKREDFVKYRNEHYVAEATTVIVSGNIDEASVLSQVEEAFKHISSTPKKEKAGVVEVQTAPLLSIKHKDTDQTHIVLGVRGYKASDPKHITLSVLSTMLGEGMSSRLFQKLRGEMGVGYYVRSDVDDYTDHGYLSVSCGVDTSRLLEVVHVILSEMKKFAIEKVSTDELNKAKEYIVGNMYLGLETSDSLAEYYAMENVVSKDILTPEAFAHKIETVTSDDVLAVAQEIFVDTGLALAIVGSVENEQEVEKNLHF